MNRVLFYLGVFFVAGATLMLQIIQTRLMSVIAWYHLAFFVISTAMFGLTLGAIWVYQKGDRFTARTLSHDLTLYCIAFAVTAALSLAVQLTVMPLLHFSLMNAIVWLELTLCLAVPFFFSGATISLALTRSPYPVGIVYGVDLMGAALGCLGVLALLNLTDAPSAVLMVAGIAALAALCFRHSQIGGRPKSKSYFNNLAKNAQWVFAALLIFGYANTVIPMEYRLKPMISKDVLQPPTVLPDYEKWNSYSRIQVMRPVNRTPYLWGPSKAYAGQLPKIRQRIFQIDGGAGTVSYRTRGDLNKAEFLKYDVTSLAYYLPGLEKGAVIGVGGGRDIMAAKLFGLEKVTGVELNPIFIDLILKENRFANFSGVRDLPGVTFQVDEARSWFARSKEQFDIIQMSLIDTFAATGAGAMTLSENGIYTVEAWQIFLDRLKDGGVFTVSRWYAPESVDETGRLVSLAVGSLLAKGIETPQDHIILASSGQVATIIVSVTPFRDEQLKVIEDICAELQYDLLIGPRTQPPSQTLAGIMNSNDMDALLAFTSGLPRDLTPPVDSRPFFFNQLRFLEVLSLFELSGSDTKGSVQGVIVGNLYAASSVLLLFVISLVLVVLAIILPLRSAISSVGRRFAWSGTGYFVLIGLGFMMVEIGMLQRFSVFLGHPVYSLSIVLFSLILFAGLGSLLSNRFPLRSNQSIIIWATATSLYLMSLVLWLPGVFLSFDSSTLLARAALCLAVILPAGLMMGYGFPTGMRLISRIDTKPTPWFWGLNGAAGVLAASVALVTSLSFSINFTLVLGAVCYLLLIPPSLQLAKS